MALAFRFVLFAGALAVACGSDAESPAATDEPPGEPSAPAREVAALLGAGGSVPPTFTLIFDATTADAVLPFYPTALAFNPAAEDELWITLRQPLTGYTCNQDDTTGCPWLLGRVAIVHGATSAPEAAPSVELKQDANAWHFMRRPSSIAFNADDTFATCGEARTSNYEDVDVPYNGPVLWSAEPAIFGARPPADSPTGSTHIDMLHESPYCMGIAHERDNVYWTFNGDVGSLDRYDFHEPHEPGGDDHSDGELERYVTGELLRMPEVPSHLAFDPESKLLYAADSGHGRIVALDTTTGKPGAGVTAYDPIPTHYAVDGAELRDVVKAGRLRVPSGLTLYGGVVFVTDALTGRIAAYDTSGHTLASLPTGLPPGSLGGMTIGPDGRAYFADAVGRRVLRIDPAR